MTTLSLLCAVGLLRQPRYGVDTQKGQLSLNVSTAGLDANSAAKVTALGQR